LNVVDTKEPWRKRWNNRTNKAEAEYERTKNHPFEVLLAELFEELFEDDELVEFPAAVELIKDEEFSAVLFSAEVLTEDGLLEFRGGEVAVDAGTGEAEADGVGSGGRRTGASTGGGIEGGLVGEIGSTTEEGETLIVEGAEVKKSPIASKKVFSFEGSFASISSVAFSMASLTSGGSGTGRGAAVGSAGVAEASGAGAAGVSVSLIPGLPTPPAVESAALFEVLPDGCVGGGT